MGKFLKYAPRQKVPLESITNNKVHCNYSSKSEKRCKKLMNWF